MSTNSTSPVRAAVLGAVAGAVAATASYFVGQGLGWLVSTAYPTPDANIGLGMAMMTVSFALAPLLVWPLLRLLGVPGAGLAALLSVPFHMVLSTALVMTALPLDPAPPVGFVWSAVAFAVATAVGVLIARPMVGRAPVRA